MEPTPVQYRRQYQAYLAEIDEFIRATTPPRAPLYPDYDHEKRLARFCIGAARDAWYRWEQRKL